MSEIPSINATGSNTPIRRRKRGRLRKVVSTTPVVSPVVSTPKKKAKRKSSSKARNPNIGSTGKMIMDGAKIIRQNNPNLAWKQCVSTSAKNLKKK